MSHPDLSLTHHLRATAVLGLPLVGGHLAQFAIGLTDTIMLGRYSAEVLAAQVLATGVFHTVFVLASGFAWAVMPLVASAAARDDQQMIRRATRMGLWLSVGLCVLFMPVFWVSGSLLRLLGQTPQVAADAQTYLRIAGLGLLPAMGVMVLKSYLAALERTQVILWITVLAAVVNAGANYVLIFGQFGAPEMGIAGAAWASVLTHAMSLVGVVLYARAVMPQHDLFRRLWRPDPEILAHVFRLGWPISLTHVAESGLFVISAIMMGWLGTVPLAAHGIAIQCASAAFMVHLGLANAATVRAGNAYGRGDRGHLWRGAQAVVGLSVGIALATSAFFVILPEPLIALFLDAAEPDRAAIVTTGIGLLAMAALFQLVDGGQVVALGLLRGLQDTRVPMIMASVAYWGIGLPAAYGLGIWLGYGGMGIWGGLVIGLAVAAGLLTFRFLRLARRFGG